MNLCELLKDKIGDKFYSPIFDIVTILDVSNDAIKISYYYQNLESITTINTDGTSKLLATKMCVLYPSKELYEKYTINADNAWEYWKNYNAVPRLESGNYYYYINTDFTESGFRIYRTLEYDTDCDYYRWASKNYFKTRSLAETAVERIKECLVNVHKEQNTNKQNL